MPFPIIGGALLEKMNAKTAKTPCGRAKRAKSARPIADILSRAAARMPWDLSAGVCLRVLRVGI